MQNPVLRYIKIFLGTSRYLWGSQRAWQHFGTTHITCSMLIHMSGDIKFSVLCTLFLEEFDLIVLIKREMAALAKSWSQRWSLDFSPFDSFDRLSFRHPGWFLFGSEKYHFMMPIFWSKKCNIMIINCLWFRKISSSRNECPSLYSGWK